MTKAIPAIFAFVLAFLAVGPAARAAQDYELGNALAERGWWDLSEEVFTRIRDTGATPEIKADGEYGLARLKILMAKRTEAPEEKAKLIDKAIKEVEALLTKHPNHPRKGEALSDIGDLYQTKGKALMAAAKVDPSKAEEAEKAFAAAEKLFTDLIAQLKKDEKRPPEDPRKDPKAQEEYERWEERMMLAKYNYGVALFNHAETYRENASKHADMRRLLEKMIKFITDEFMWQYERYLLAYDASVYVGRAYQLMAESADREKAEEYWRQAFMNLGRPRSLLGDPENRKSEDVRDVAAHALLFEIKARLAYGDARRGQAAAKQYGDAARLAEDFFKMFPQVRLEEIGKALLLEQARAYCKAGQMDKGAKLLQELKTKYKDTWVESLAIDYLGEYAATDSVQLAIEAADNFMERGPAYVYRAIQKYRRALESIRRPEDQKFIPYCWAQLGKCYFLLGRYYEAVAALSMLEKPPFNQHEKAPEAALRKLTSLGKIAQATGDKADQKAFEDYRVWVTRAFPNQASDQLVRGTAIDYDDKRQFDRAAAEWAKLAQPGRDIYEEAIFSMGFSLYNYGVQLLDQARGKPAAERDRLLGQAADAWKRALEAFRKHLEFVEKLSGKEPRVVRRAVGSVYFSARILSHDRIGRPQEALAISQDADKRFPSADPKLLIAILSSRIDAKVRLGQVQEAEDDLRTLKERYEKEGGLGMDHYARSLAILANAFEEAAEKERGKNPELYDLYAVKAATYYYEYYNLNPSAVARPEQMEAMADKLFMAAEQRLKLGEQKLGKEGMEEVRRIYSKALELYKGFLLEKEAQLPKDQLRALKSRLTRCMLRVGQFEEAVKIYEEIVRNDPEMRDGSSWEDLSDCYVAQAGSMPKGAARNQLLRQAEKNYAQLAGALMARNLYNEHTYRLLYKRAECLFELDPDALARFFDTMELRGYAPAWDADEKGQSRWGYREKLENLRKKLEEILPRKKP